MDGVRVGHRLLGRVWKYRAFRRLLCHFFRSCGFSGHDGQEPFAAQTLRLKLRLRVASCKRVSLCPRTHEDVALLILLLDMGWWSSQQSWDAGNAHASYSWWTEQQWWQCDICSGWTREAKKKCSKCGCKRTWAQQSVASDRGGKQGTNLIGSRGLEKRQQLEKLQARAAVVGKQSTDETPMTGNPKADALKLTLGNLPKDDSYDDVCALLYWTRSHEVLAVWCSI